MSKTATLRQLVEVKEIVRYNGESQQITPRLIEGVFGDGKQLIGLEPLGTRPNYYVVRIDSTWDVRETDYPFVRSVLRDHLEGIYLAIERQFGKLTDIENLRCKGCGKVTCKACTGRSADCWPILNLDYGSSWFPLDWPEPEKKASGYGK